MPEPLTQSLVAHGRLTPEAAEEALERQVLMGGALDTALFELGLVDEPEVLEALQDAYGLEVARPQEASRPVDGRALRALPEQWARKHRLAPLSMEDDGRTLSVLTPAPADVQLVVRFAELLETTLRPVLAPEFRVEERLALLYGYEPDERHRALIAGFGGRLPSLGPAAAEHDLDFSAAVARLRDPKSRDHVARTTLRHVGRKLDFTALFMVQDGFLEGWMARGEGSENVPSASIPVDPDSAFRVVLDTSAHYLGPLAVDASHDPFLRSLGRPHPRSVLIVPLRIRERTVALLYGENGPREIPTRLAADVMLFVSHVQAALLTLLLRRKAGSLTELPASESMETVLPPSLAPQPERLPTPPLAEEESSTPAPKPLQVPLGVSAEEALFDPDSVDEGSLDPSEPLIAMHLAELAARQGRVPPPPLPLEEPGIDLSGEPAIEEVELEQVSVDLEEPTLEPGGSPTPVLSEQDEPLEVEIQTDGLSDAPTSEGPNPLSMPVGLDTSARLEEEAERLEPLTSFLAEANDDDIIEALTPRALEEPDAFIPNETANVLEEEGEGPTQRFESPPPGPEGAIILEEPPPPGDGDTRPELELVDRGLTILEPEEATLEASEDLPVATEDTPGELGPMPGGPPIEGEHGAEDDGWADLEPEAPLDSPDTALGRPEAAEEDGWARVSAPNSKRPETIDVPLSALSVTEDGEPKAARSGDVAQEEDERDDDGGREDDVETDPRLELGATPSIDLGAPDDDSPTLDHGGSDSADVVSEVSRRLVDDRIWDEVEVPETPSPKIEAEVLPEAPSVSAVDRALEQELPAPADDGWRAVESSAWDEAAPETEPQGAAPAEEEAFVPRGPEPEHEPEIGPPSGEIPDLGTEAWLKASSETVRARPIPIEVMERASLPPQPEESEEETEAVVESLPSGDLDERAFERQVTERLEQLEHPMKRVRGMAREALAAMGGRTLPYLAERFPGPLAVNPFAPEVVLPPFAECGPLLSLFAHHGRPAHEYVQNRLDAPDSVIRFFATYFYSAVYVPEAVPRLIQRLHDEEARICMTAARTLFGYRSHSAFRQVLDHLHGRLGASSVAARRHAAFLIGVFRDVTAVPQLIEIIERRERAVSDVAEAALSEITKQRFGSSARRWRAWWAKNEHRNRIEWLIEGLSSRDEAIRKSACEELRAVTGQSFGYDPVAPRRKREEARRRWTDWWRSAGESARA